jgi:hypothetical protein
MKPLRPPVRTALALRTGIRPGNVLSDYCYAERNWENLWVGFNGKGWYPEARLKDCLALSGEKNWWQVFVPDLDQKKACQLTISSQAWFNPNFTAEQTKDWMHWKLGMIYKMGCFSYLL